MGVGRLEPSFKEFLKSLNATRVRYLVLGGYAVNYYGYQRYTKDLDVWVAIDARNCERLSTALQEFGGFRPDQVSPPTTGRTIFVLGREPIRIDVINDPNGVEFESCWQRRNEVQIDGVQVPFIALEDLRANKLASARGQDVVDVSKLPPTWPPPVSQQRKSRRGR